MVGFSSVRRCVLDVEYYYYCKTTLALTPMIYKLERGRERERERGREGRRGEGREGELERKRSYCSICTLLC